ncbi:MAG TPA: hypothetical protein VE871_03345 [Longimicrobium sp.]|nr:hypothetical protein [Longimicrobium sp.]
MTMMEQIASDGRRVFHFRVLAPGEGLDPPFGGEPYAALVWAACRTTDVQKERPCTDLVESGCRYIVCGGAASEVWEEVADEVIVAQDRMDLDSPAEFVMTTSRTRETIDEAAYFLVRCTSFGHHDFTRYIVLLIGDDARVRETLIASIRAYAGAES